MSNQDKVTELFNALKSNKSHMKVIGKYINHNFNVFLDNYNHPNSRNILSPRMMPDWWSREYKKNSKSHWDLYIVNNLDGIIIPFSYQDELLTGSKPSIINPQGPLVRYEYVFSTKAGILLFFNAEEYLAVPAGMDGKHRMVMEFPDLDDFIAYLEEEMAKGNYPRHLSSDWR